MRWHLYICQYAKVKWPIDKIIFKATKEQKRESSLSEWTVGDGARWSLRRSTPNLAALHSSPTISPPASNTPTYPSSSQPAIPTQGDSPKIRTFNLPNSTHPILFPQWTSRAGKSELQEKKGSSLRGQVRWPAVGSSASSNHQAKDVLIHLHL